MVNSFITFMALLPVILPTWQEGPMPKDFLSYEREGYQSEQAATNKQVEALKIKDPIFKLVVLSKLSSLKSQEAAKILYDFLAKEKKSIMRVAALDYLYDCEVIENKKAGIKKLINGQTDEGIAAARLYCTFPNVDLNEVIKLLSNSSLKDKVTLARALAATKRVKGSEWRQIYKKSKEYSFRKIVLKELAESPDKEGIPFLQKTLKTGSLVEKAMIALHLKPTKGTAGLIVLCMVDKHGTVRAAGARAAGILKNQKFQAKLLQLTRDQNSEVRQASVRSMRVFPNKKSVVALVKSLGDKELLVQKVAVESLKIISKSFDIEPLTKPFISVKKIGQRRWSAHLLGFLKQKQHAKKILIQLRKETDFDARTEQVYALGQFKYEISLKEVKKLSVDHARVRASLMHYLGRIDKEKYFSYMQDAAMKDLVGPVRWAALEAMGNNGSPWFNKTLVAIMNDVAKSSMRDYQDRAVACWAAGRIRGLSKPMIDVMIKFMNRPTIPVEMGPNTYDNPQVLFSIFFAFADQYHRGGEKKAFFFKYAKSFHFRFLKDRRSVEFPRNYHNDNYANQGWAYLNNEKAPRVELPPKKVKWYYKTANRK